MSNEGLDKVLIKLADMLDQIEKLPLYEEEEIESHVLYKFERTQPFTITHEGNEWVIRGNEVEKLLRMTRFTTDEAANRFANKLRKMGIDEKLRSLGAKEGDTVRILDFEFEYKE
jgi:GTP-binding protein